MNAQPESGRCPFCGGEMTAGRLMSKSGTGAGLYYLPKGQRPGAFDTQKKIEDKGGVVLEAPSLTRFGQIDVACRGCSACRKIVIAY
ncbi:MAG: hypothetical protein GX540_06425 [Clostridiales bacterium]|nr:hypothetical protein [Clostridiales bacterium]